MKKHKQILFSPLHKTSEVVLSSVPPPPPSFFFLVLRTLTLAAATTESWKNNSLKFIYVFLLPETSPPSVHPPSYFGRYSKKSVSNIILQNRMRGRVQNDVTIVPGRLATPTGCCSERRKCSRFSSKITLEI